MKTTLVILGIAGFVFAGVVLFAGWQLGFFGGTSWSGAFGEQTRGHLGSIRSGLSIYYGDMEGQYPQRLEAALDKRWLLEKLPPAQTRIHSDSTKIVALSGADYAAKNFSDSGGWYYVVDGLMMGNVGVDCTHTDSKGKLWYAY